MAKDEDGRTFFGMSASAAEEKEAGRQREVGLSKTGAGAGFALEPRGVAGLVVSIFAGPTAADPIKASPGRRGSLRMNPRRLRALFPEA